MTVFGSHIRVRHAYFNFDLANQTGYNRAMFGHPMRLGIFTFAFLAMFALPNSGASNPVRLATSDARVAYFYSQADQIDWPTLWYLQETYGLELSLVRLTEAPRYKSTSVVDPISGIGRFDFLFDPTKGAHLDSVRATLFAPRPPDLVLIDLPSSSAGQDSLLAKILAQPAAKGTPPIFTVQRVFHRRYEPATAAAQDPLVTINQAELAAKHRNDILALAQSIFPQIGQETEWNFPLCYYQLSWGSVPTTKNFNDLVTGLSLFRLKEVIDQSVTSDAVRISMRRRADRFQSLMRASDNQSGKAAVESAISAYRELLDLQTQATLEKTLKENRQVLSYIRLLVRKAERAALWQAGVRFDGKITIRESPEGTTVKFVASVAAQGPSQVDLVRIRFHPYWDTTTVQIDSILHQVSPHQTFVQEYLVEVPREKLSSLSIDSLQFSADLVCNRLPLTVNSSLPLREALPVSVAFLPPFRFVPPVARVEIDKTVGQMLWSVQITKPFDMVDNVKLHLDVPRGLYAGAYKQEITLEKGKSSELVSIPFSVSNLFELGVQPLTMNLLVNDKIVDQDTAIIRIAECEMSDKITVGFLPDSSGMLEDVLRMTSVGFQPLTDRGLLTSNLDAYSTVIFGSNSAGKFPSLELAAARLEDFVRAGGSIIILAQPDNFPRILPITLNAGARRVTLSQIQTRLPEAKLLTKPYVISSNNLFAPLENLGASSPAVVSPAEVVCTTSDGKALLSVSRLGDGEIIYCGLPLLELIGELNIDAIHLLANLMNY